jgi:hypothetical protein
MISKSARHMVLDLGEVRGAADIKVNGVPSATPCPSGAKSAAMFLADNFAETGTLEIESREKPSCNQPGFLLERCNFHQQNDFF